MRRGTMYVRDELQVLRADIARGDELPSAIVVPFADGAHAKEFGVPGCELAPVALSLGPGVNDVPAIAVSVGDDSAELLREAIERFEAAVLVVPGNHCDYLNGKCSGSAGMCDPSGILGSVTAVKRNAGGVYDAYSVDATRDQDIRWNSLSKATRQQLGPGGIRPKNLFLLIECGVRIRGTVFYGHALSPSGDKPKRYSEFQVDKDIVTAARDKIPTDCVLLTHRPARGAGDLCGGNRLGDESLTQQLKKIRPRIIISGDVHEGGGSYGRLACKTVWCNAAVSNGAWTRKARLRNLAPVHQSQQVHQSLKRKRDDAIALTPDYVRQNTKDRLLLALYRTGETQVRRFQHIRTKGCESRCGRCPGCICAEWLPKRFPTKLIDSGWLAVPAQPVVSTEATTATTAGEALLQEM